MARTVSLLRSLGLGAALLCIGLSAPSMAGEQTDFTPAVKVSGKAAPEIADGSLSPAARYALENGYLPQRPAAALARQRLAGTGTAPRLTGLVSEASIRATLTLKRTGLSARTRTPPNIGLAVGLDTYIQAVNSEVALYTKSTGALRASATLNQWAATGSLVKSFHPRVIWDPTTNRYYYVMNSVYSATNNKISIGFSRNSSPTNMTTDWCHYQISLGSRFPDFPQLGDAATFLMVGVNSYDGSAAGAFLGADLVFVDKPTTVGTITSCPASLVTGTKTNLVDTTGAPVFAPVPADQVDTITGGFVVARNGALPSAKVWIYQVARSSTGWVTARRDLREYGTPTTNTYDVPPSAPQPLIDQTLDTLDARFTQAIMAYSPTAQRNIMWTVQTAYDYYGTVLNVLAIDPRIVPLDTATPRLLTTKRLYSSIASVFNGAVTTDRRVDGAQKLYGDNVGVTASIAGRYYTVNTNPSIVFDSSQITYGGTNSIYLSSNGSQVVTTGVGPYRDAACPVAGDVCPWGTTAAAVPDPRPYNRTTGLMWFSNQYSGVYTPPTTTINWRTQVFAVAP